ncbi:unnamed protein product [Ilex paraguariensis]|uniref:tetraacyldisaccharide 4'-kinase n=1 Tax=Ilex paraguariensis TaxID=185542 RepID=A0ABC8RC84_9AQUA
MVEEVMKTKFYPKVRIALILYEICPFGRQHLSLLRDIEIVMVNGMMPWGNHQLLPLGPLREPLTALNRAHVVVIHHADLV